MKKFTEYEQEKAKKEIEKNLDYHVSMLAACAKVKRLYKKDGGSFSNLAANFEGVTVSNARYTLHNNEKEITISAYSQKNGYISESFTNIETVGYRNHPEPAPERIIKESCLTPYYYLTVDEIADRIEDEKNRHARRVEELSAALQELDNAGKGYAALIDQINVFFATIPADIANEYKRDLRSFY